MNIFKTRRALALGLLALATASHASPWKAGNASYHPYPHRGYVCAARGVPRGSVLRVRYLDRAIDVEVVDACGITMKKRHRHIDLNEPAFIALFGSLRRGVGPVKYKLVKRGKGAMTGRAW